ncbi:MAG: hypothetical protein OXC94_00170 [Chloroflexi bacterium]|nr:hypothetical protein [Chloroflexota bacterium]
MLLCCLALLVVAPAAAQEPPAGDVAVEVRLDPPTAVLGETVRLVIRVEHGADQVVAVGRVDQAVAIQLVEDARVSEGAAAAGRLTSEYVYTIAAFSLGLVELGEAEVRALRDDGSRTVLRVALPPLRVEATTAADDERLRPLTPQRDVGGAPRPWERFEVIAGALVAAAALLSLLLAWRLLRSLLLRRSLARAREERAQWPLEEEARRRLDALAQRGAPESGEESVAYYREIASVVRAYLEARGGFRATALTTNELESRMLDEGIDRWQARLIVGLLERCDGSVYAHRHPDRDSADHDLTLAYEIVELGRARAQESSGDGEDLEAAGGEAE